MSFQFMAEYNGSVPFKISSWKVTSVRTIHSLKNNVITTNSLKLFHVLRPPVGVYKNRPDDKAVSPQL